MTPPDDPHWYRDAVIYQLNVKAFFDSNGDGIGDFPGVTAKLDYVRDLGVNTIWLMPFYPSPLRDDGYDIADYQAVHPPYGTLDDFRTMLAEAHRRGLRVITELVINHTSDQHPWFQAARQAPPGSPERDFYVWSDTDARYAGTRIIFTDTETSNWTWDPVARAYFWHRFFSHQPDLNYDNPAVLEAVFQTMRFWLDMGVDGFRLDAIPYLVEREGTSNENLPETHAVIRQLRAAIDAHYPNRFLLAEANMWPEDVRGYFGNGDACHMAYHFPLMPRMYMAIAHETRDPIVEILAQTPEIPAGCQWAIFLRNHDELTLEMVTSRERDAMWALYAADPRARINLGIRRRLAPLMDNDLDRIKLMNSLLLSMPGSPIIYYGDEIGMGDNVFVGDRNGVRTPMQWSPDRNAGFSRADPQRLYLQPIMDAVYGYQARNVEAQAGQPGSLLNWTRRMLAVRATSSAFGRGTRRFLRPGNRKVLAYVAEHGGDVLLFVANLARSAQPVELDLAPWRGRVPVELLGRAAFPAIGESPYALSLAAHGFYWFRLATDVTEPRWHHASAPVDDRPVLVLFDGWNSLFRDRVMPWRIGMAEHVRTQFETETLPRHLAAQPGWGAAAQARRVALADHGLWTDGAHTWLLLLLAPEPPGPAAAAAQRWFQPLALAWEDDAVAGGDEPLRALAPGGVARVRQQARLGLLADALFDDAFVRAVVRAIGDRASVPMAGGRLQFQPAPAYAGLVDRAALAAAAIARPGSDGAQALVLIGETLQLQALRRVRPGLHPALQLGRFLAARAGPAPVLPIAGALDHVADGGTPTTLALLQAQVQNQGDGRAWVEAYLDRFLDDWRTDPAAERVSVPADVHGACLLLLQTVGRCSGALHQALATVTGDPAFDPEPMTPSDWAADVAEALAGARDTLDLLAAQPTAAWPAALRGAVRGLLTQREALLRRIAQSGSAAGPARKTRVHGGLRLADVLLVHSEVVFTGFGGGGDRAFALGSRKASPLRDVAAMLQSFSRARVAALQRLGAGADAGQALRRLLRGWEQQARQAFLAAYDAAAPAPAQPWAGDWLWLYEADAALQQLGESLRDGSPLAVPLLPLVELLGRAEAVPPHRTRTASAGSLRP